jgi:hypothetical protein
MRLNIELPFSAGNLDLESCPHCAVDKPFIIGCGSPFETQDHLAVEKRVWRNFFCRRCGGAFLVGTDSPGGLITELYPSGPEELDPSIPGRAKHYLEETQRSLHTPSGALMVAASAVDAMLKAKGYKEGDLYPRIKQAVRDHLITEDMEKWAHQVRLDANQQRHADEEPPLPMREDAQRSLTFALALAQFLFVLPALVQKGLKETKSEKP